LPAPAAAPISDEEFRALQRMILDHAGIALAESKRQLVTSRLAKRLRHYGYSTFTQYVDHLERDDVGTERIELLNAITTNLTAFFREAHHFDFLRDHLSRAIERRVKEGEPRRIRIWSAACSTGEEVYSVAITLREAFGEMRGWDVKILASDLDTNVLRKAGEGVYDPQRLAGLPRALRLRYFQPDGDGQFRVLPALRELITFRKINLNEAWGFRASFDAIFCRNVIIYFNRTTQESLLRRMSRCLHPEGHLFLGHSESLHWMGDLYRPMGRTIYRLSGDTTPEAARRTALADTREAPKAGHRPERGDGARRIPSPRLRPGRVARPAPAEIDETSLRAETIHIGDVFASREPAIVRTVLGSCVSVCLFDPDRRIGGMNHFMLPESPSPSPLPSRYGVHAMELLINEVMKLGGDRRRLEAKLVGGANVLRKGGASFGIGDQNVEFAQSFLARERIPVVAERVGGDQPFQVAFHTHSGRVRLRTLVMERIGDLVQEELRFRIRVTQESEAPPPESGVTLF
jgi:chemotaxis protein methyltransferase CheR